MRLTLWKLTRPAVVLGLWPDLTQKFSTKVQPRSKIQDKKNNNSSNNYGLRPLAVDKYFKYKAIFLQSIYGQWLCQGGGFRNQRTQVQIQQPGTKLRGKKKTKINLAAFLMTNAYPNKTMKLLREKTKWTLKRPGNFETLFKKKQS